MEVKIKDEHAKTFIEEQRHLVNQTIEQMPKEFIDVQPGKLDKFRLVLANLVKQARGGSGEDPTAKVLVYSSTQKMDIRQSEKGYHSILVMEMPLADNIE